MAPLLASADDRAFAATISELVYCNPFTEKRLNLERQALGPAYEETPRGWNVDPMREQRAPNVARILERCEATVRASGNAYRMGEGSDRDRAYFTDTAFFLLYHRFQQPFDKLIARAHQEGHGQARVTFHAEFQEAFTGVFGSHRPIEPAHLFACFFQIRRAFHHIFRFFVGGIAGGDGAAQPGVGEHLHARPGALPAEPPRRMGEIPTLITGPSGTGKEVVARAIGLSRYIPFSVEQRQFASDFVGSFYPVNLSALSPTLIESELFGHRRGAFTGALQDRQGYFEASGAHGTVFLDEIGEADPQIQVKLLRVLQTRQFTPLGETKGSTFLGKVVAATNRSLPEAIAAGRFREDLFYRLRADEVTTPTLRELLAGEGSEFAYLVRYIAERLAGPDEAADLAQDVLDWASAHAAYGWPGNFRELEQAVRQILLRREYEPAPVGGTGEAGWERLATRGWTLDELQRAYVTAVHAQAGSYEETARRLDVDRRTVKKYLQPTGER